MNARESVHTTIGTTPASAGFDPSTVGAIASALTAILADMFALYIKTKNFHWHVSGPHFRDYHLLLDEQSGQIFAATEPPGLPGVVGGAESSPFFGSISGPKLVHCRL